MHSQSNILLTATNKNVLKRIHVVTPIDARIIVISEILFNTAISEQAENIRNRLYLHTNKVTIPDGPP